MQLHGSCIVECVRKLPVIRGTSLKPHYMSHTITMHRLKSFVIGIVTARRLQIRIPRFNARPNRWIHCLCLCVCMRVNFVLVLFVITAYFHHDLNTSCEIKDRTNTTNLLLDTFYCTEYVKYIYKYQWSFTQYDLFVVPWWWCLEDWYM